MTIDVAVSLTCCIGLVLFATTQSLITIVTSVLSKES